MSGDFRYKGEEPKVWLCPKGLAVQQQGKEENAQECFPGCVSVFNTFFFLPLLSRPLSSAREIFWVAAQSVLEKQLILRRKIKWRDGSSSEWKRYFVNLFV